MFAITTLLLSLPAQALDCMPVHMGATLPTDGAVEVPINALPTLELYTDLTLEDLRLTLTTGDGASVEAVAVMLSEGDPIVVQLRPERELDVDRDHLLRAEQVHRDGTVEDVAEVAFRTGVRRDEDAPEEAHVVDVSQEMALGGHWGDEYSVRLDVDGGQDPSGSMLHIELSSGSDFSDPIERTRVDSPAVISHGLCTMDAAAKREVETMWVRVTPVDVAGNRGASFVYAPVEQLREPDGGCHISGVQLGWIGVLVGLIGALRRSD